MDGPLSQFAQVRGGQLYISPVTAADAGRYRCTVVTQGGSTEAFSQVFISGERRGSSGGMNVCGEWAGREARRFRDAKGQRGRL